MIFILNNYKKMKRFPLSLCFGVFSFILITFLTSCVKTSPKPPVDERLNKGHDQPTIAQITLTPGTLKAGKVFSPEMSPEDVELGSEQQTIELDQSRGQIKYTEGNGYVRRFSVESTTKNPNRVYLIQISYKTANREVMNAQLTSDEQINRHQHFFKQVLSYSKDGLPEYAKYKGAMSYDYAYCDRIVRKQSNGSEYVDANPIGLSGFIKFVKPEMRAEDKEVTILITLGHFFNSKFISSGSKAIRQFYSTVLPGADTDINMTIHFDLITK